MKIIISEERLVWVLSEVEVEVDDTWTLEMIGGRIEEVYRNGHSLGAGDTAPPGIPPGILSGFIIVCNEEGDEEGNPEYEWEVIG